MGGVGGCGGPHDFSVSPSPLGTNLGFELGCTGFGVGPMGYRLGLDKNKVTGNFEYLKYSDCRM